MDIPQKSQNSILWLYTRELPAIIRVLSFNRRIWRNKYKWIDNIRSIDLIYRLFDVVTMFDGLIRIETMIGHEEQMLLAIHEMEDMSTTDEYGDSEDTSTSTRLIYITDLIYSMITYPCDPERLIYLITEYVIDNNINLLEASQHTKELLEYVNDYYYNEKSYAEAAERILDTSIFDTELESKAEERDIDISYYLGNNERIKPILADVLKEYHLEGNDYTMFNRNLDKIVNMFLEEGG